MFENQIKQMQNEIVDKVLGCVRINSVQSEAREGMPFGEGPCEALRYTLNLAEQMGFRTKNLDNQIGYAEYGEGDEMIAVLGHLDIVPVGDGWEHDPFGEIDGDRLYGRGTLDDKGPVIGALFALAAIRDSKMPLERRIRVIFGTNEETGSKDVEHYNQTEETPVMGFTPDADYPVIFSEKGMAGFTLEKKLGKGSSQGMSLLSAHGGTAVNLVPDQARVLLITENNSPKEIIAQGRSAHASTPEEGKNAIAELMEQLRQMPLSSELKSFVDFYNTFIGRQTNGKKLGLLWETEKFGSTTVNAGLLEGDANYIKITFDCRYPVGAEIEKSLGEAAEKARHAGMDLTITRNTPPLYVPEDSKLVTTLQQVYQEQTGTEAKPVVIGGGTYAKSMKNIVAFGPVFPNQENVIHQKNEYISIDHLIKNIEIMANAMYQLAR